MKRNLTILAVILVALWGAWYMYSRSERRELSIAERHEFFWVDTLKVDSVYFKYADWTHIVKRGDRWVVRSPLSEVPATTGLLSKVMQTGNEMVLENVISTNPEKSRTFEADTIRGRVMRYFGGGQPLAEFVIGKIGADMSHTYVRPLNSDTVYLARGRFDQLFTLVPDMWRSLQVFEYDSALVDTIRWVYPNRETRLLRGGDRKWQIWRTGMKESRPADPEAAAELVARVAQLKVDAYHPEGNPDVGSFDTLALQLIVTTSSGSADTLIVNHIPEGHQRMFVRRPSRPIPVYLFFQRNYDRLQGRFEDLVALTEPNNPE